MTNTQDEFAQESGYSRDKFYTAATDGSNGSTQVHIKIPSSVAGELGSLVASRVIPDYRTAHDVIRNGLVHQLHYDMERVKDPAVVMRLQALHQHILALNLLEDIERREQTQLALQQKTYSVNVAMLSGKDRIIGTSQLEAAIALLDDRPDLQAILRSKL